MREGPDASHISQLKRTPEYRHGKKRAPREHPGALDFKAGKSRPRR
jgi:hypothetical protein